MLTENILLLQRKFPIIRECLSKYQSEIPSNRIMVFDAKSGKKTLLYSKNENHKLMVHSKYDPIREADKLIFSHKEEITSDTHVFFYGMGLGYHIKRFLELFPKNSYSIYEPVPEIFSEMTKHVNLKTIFTKNLTNLYIDINRTESTEYLNEFESNNRPIHLIVLPSYQNVAKEKLNQFQDCVRNVVENRWSNLRVNVNFQKLWVLNSILNFKSVLGTPNILKDINQNYFKGKPAIIVSAGPSLAEDIEYIRYIKENNLAYLFSVGSAINSLIEFGITPDAICTYDPGTNNHIVFQKMIKKGVINIPMVFGSSVGYETLMRYEGPKVHFVTSQDKASIYFLNNEIDLNDLIIDSPSIAVMMFQLLNKLGAEPIIFAGQNLGYLYERRYAEGIEYEHVQSSVDVKEMDKALTTLDVFGNEIKTNNGFIKMRENIEYYAKVYAGNTFINTTKGGAAIEGVPFIPIEEVIKNVLTNKVEKHVWWIEQNKYDKSKIGIQICKLEIAIKEFKTLLDKFDNILESISNFTKNRNRDNLINALKNFDMLYNTLIENEYYKNFLSFYIRVNVQIIGNEIKRLNGEKDNFIKGHEIVRLFGGFLEKCRVHTKELEEIIKNEFENLK